MPIEIVAVMLFVTVTALDEDAGYCNTLSRMDPSSSSIHLQNLKCLHALRLISTEQDGTVFLL